MLYAVFITSCLMSNPTECKKEYVGDVRTPTPIGCLMGGQSYLREWIEKNAHRKIIFKSLKCVDIRRKDFEMGRDQA